MALATGPVKATGTTLGYEASGSTFTTVGQLISFDFGGTSISSIDLTILNSPAMASMSSIPDNGELNFTVFLVASDATVVQLQAWSQASVTVPWKVMLPDGSSGTTGTTITFNAYLTKFAPKDFKQGEAPKADVTIKITGLVTMTAGS